MPKYKTDADEANDILNEGVSVEDKDVTEAYESDIKPGPGKMSRELASFWLSQCQSYESDRSAYVTRGNNVVKRYRDDRNKASENARKLNTLWANTKILMPALYSKCPLPVIDRKFLDKDPVARLSSQIAERSIRNEVESNGLHAALKGAVLDYLLSGQGMVWVRYEGKVGKSLSLKSGMTTSMEDDLTKIEDKEGGKASSRENDEETEKLEDTGEQLISESAPVDYIDWKDWGTLPSKARTWAEVQAVFKRVRISKKEAVERFGEDIGKEMMSNNTPLSELNQRSGRIADSVINDVNDRSIDTYEVWNKIDRRVYWVSSGYEYLCDVRDDPLQLEGYFPCPPVILSTSTNDTLIPIPDYYEWQDQALQIDELTMRIAMLTKACKIAGTYDAQVNELKRVFQESVENELIPVDQWAVHKERGGIPGSISLLPLKEIQEVIRTLQEVRKSAMEDLDLITGITDIMRGTTDSRETLGGLRLKNNNTGTRLSERQDEVARFARDTIRIVCEIMCKHFSDKTLIEMSGIMFEEEFDIPTIKNSIKQAMMAQFSAQQPPQSPQQQPAQPNIPNNVVPFNRPGVPTQQPIPPAPPQLPENLIDALAQMKAEQVVKDKIDKAIKLLRSDIPRKYRIDIETDSTIFADAAQEKNNAVEFIGAFTKFLSSAEQITEKMPEAMPLMGQMLQFGVRKFRTGRDLESAIGVFIEKMTKKSEKLIANPPPSPDQIKAQAIQQQQQNENQRTAMEIKAQQADAQASMQLNSMEAQTRQREIQLETQKEMASAQLEAQIAEKELQYKLLEMERKHQYEVAKHEREMQKLRTLDVNAAERKASGNDNT